MTADAFNPKKAAHPLRFIPQYKDYLWGGRRIAEHFNRPAPAGHQAESWEVSIRPDAPSVVAGGRLDGTRLADLYPDFPLLLKVLDARETLSVQVHPDEAAAARHGGEPKTEMWYVLAADPGAAVYCGLQSGTDEAALRRALAENRVGDLLIKIPVAPGDAIYVPGGTVHAIGSGCLLLECQQNSNTTWRLHDWNRKAPDGQPRELHIEQALRCINWTGTAAARVAPRTIEPGRTEIINSPYFRVERLDLTPGTNPAIGTDRKPKLLFIATGTVALTTADFSETAAPGTTYLLPENLPIIGLVPATPATALLISIP